MDTSNTSAGVTADNMIAAEVSVQQKMWGDPNERADGMNGQLLGACMAHINAVAAVAAMPYLKRAVIFKQSKTTFYPKDWSPDAFRDYGSDIANLVVAAAYLRNEIKRRLLRNEPTYRAPRTAPYVSASPAMSSADAGAGEAEQMIIGQTHVAKVAAPVYAASDPRSDTI